LQPQIPSDPYAYIAPWEFEEDLFVQDEMVIKDLRRMQNQSSNNSTPAGSPTVIRHQMSAKPSSPSSSPRVIRHQLSAKPSLHKADNAWKRPNNVITKDGLTKAEILSALNKLSDKTLEKLTTKICDKLITDEDLKLLANTMHEKVIFEKGFIEIYGRFARLVTDFCCKSGLGNGFSHELLCQCLSENEKGSDITVAPSNMVSL
jgi:hypothetical protein